MHCVTINVVITKQCDSNDFLYMFYAATSQYLTMSLASVNLLKSQSNVILICMYLFHVSFHYEAHYNHIN